MLARSLAPLGHEVRLIPAQHVKAFVRVNHGLRRSSQWDSSTPRRCRIGASSAGIALRLTLITCGVTMQHDQNI